MTVTVREPDVRVGKPEKIVSGYQVIDDRCPKSGQNVFRRYVCNPDVLFGFQMYLSRFETKTSEIWTIWGQKQCQNLDVQISDRHCICK